MTRPRPRPATALLLVLLVGCGASEVTAPPSPSNPYAGLQQRQIRALSPERVADLLAGRGLGYALAAELNRHPGPMHVLGLAEQLELTAEQTTEVRAIERTTHAEARWLGAEIVALERDLDAGFRSGDVDGTRLEELTARIAAVEGRLRAVHLEAHVLTRDVLTPEQVVRYDHLRGYTGDGVDHGPGHHDEGD